MTNKITAIALTALIGLGAVATPVLAGPGVSAKFDAGFYLQQLRYDGVNALSVQDVGNDNIQARVIDADGQTIYQLFNKDTFALVK